MEKQEFLDWLDGFKGTETIRFMVANHSYTDDELETLRTNFARYLTPKPPPNRKGKFHVH